MVHAVAEALRAECRKQFGTDWNYDVSWALARAAIEAMRSPTDEMITAICGGRFIENDGEGGAWIDADGAAWLMDAVVNAALNPQTAK